VASEEANAKPKPPPPIATDLGALLKQAGITAAPAKQVRGRGPHTLPPPSPEPLGRVSLPPPAPSTPVRHPAAELRALNDAYAGVRKLSGKSKSMPFREVVVPTQHVERRAQAQQEEAAARARLGALVAGGVRFKVRRDDGFVEALRTGASAKLLARVSGRGFAPEATLDLHGLREAEVPLAVTDFVRKRHRQGARHLLLITGKGLHSQGGTPVLREAAVEALTTGGAAPLVLAFASAHQDHGGSGAFAILLDA